MHPWILLLVVLGFPQVLFPASLPKSTQRILQELRVDPSFLGDIDKELNVPKDWIEGARKERTVRYLSGKRPVNYKSIFGPFTERYPFIDVDFTSSGHEARAIKTLVAYRSGRIVADVLDSVGGNIRNFRLLNSLDGLQSLPNARMIPEDLKDKEGGWIAANSAFYCLAYNKKLASPGDLPKKWEDLLSSSRWRDGKLGMANRATLGPIHLWKAKGEVWTKSFFTRLFKELKPQLRTESLNALIELLAAGEFQLLFPAGLGTVAKFVEKGAPLGVSCPEPVLGNINELIILRGSHVNAARLLVNWLLSKEGQMSFYHYNLDIPIRDDVRSRVKFLFNDEVHGKQITFKDPGVEDEMGEVEAFWSNLWLKSGGKAR